MAKKVGTLIKEARTAAGLTQEQLARKIKGLSASDIGRAERGEKDLTQEQLKAIAKATGVTQKSLLEAAKGKTAAAKTSSGSGKTSGTGKTSSSAKTSSTSKTSTELKLTAAEKKLVQLYRKADKDKKEAAVKVLQGESAGVDGLLGDLVGSALGALAGKLGAAGKREMPGGEEDTQT